MIIAIVNQAGDDGSARIASNLAVLRARSGRKVLLLDTDPKKPFCIWSTERGAAGMRPRIPARAIGGSGPQPALEDMLLHYNDILIDAAGRDTRASRIALAAAKLVVVPVLAQPIDLALQYQLIGRLHAARTLNPGLRVLFVMVEGQLAPSDEARAAVRAYVSRVDAATLAATVIHVSRDHEYGQGRCLCDAETCDPDLAGEMHALYREVYAMNTPSACSVRYR